MSTFANRLHTIARRGESAAQQSWDEVLALPAIAITTSEVLQLGSLAAQIGGTLLGRFVEVAEFLAALRAHAALGGTAEGSDDVVRSLWRAEGVMRRCAGGDDQAFRAAGIASPADACRYAGVLAQTLAMRGRLSDAVAPMREATALCAQLPPTDPVVAQTTVIAANVGRLALDHAHRAHDLALAAAEGSLASDGRQADWRRQHLAHFAQVRALLITGRPGEALRTLHRLMDLEDQHGAGAFERFHTAAMACRAYHARGDAAQATRTLEACRDFATRATAHDLRAEVTALERLLTV